MTERSDVLALRIDNLENAVHEIRDSTKSIEKSMQKLAAMEARHENILHSMSRLQIRSDKQGELLDLLAQSHASTKTTVAWHNSAISVVAAAVVVGFVGAVWSLFT